MLETIFGVVIGGTTALFSLCLCSAAKQPEKN